MRPNARAVAVIGAVVLCNIALAADLRCLATATEGIQPGVKVTLSPGDVTRRTDRMGLCTFTGLAAGTYRVTAEKVVDGAPKAAIRDEARVPAAGRADVRLYLKEAIRIHEYMPLRAGSWWCYGVETYRITEPVFIFPGGRTREWSSMSRADVGGTTRFAGRTVTALEWQAGWLTLGPSHTMYETSSSEGYAIPRRSPRSGDESAFRYNPPLLIPDLCPLGHTHRLETTVDYVDDTPDKRVTRTYKLTKLERVWLDAGVFNDCARIDWTEEMDGETRTGTMYLARDVGMVFMHSRQGEEGRDDALRSYHIPEPLPPPVLRREERKKPSLPSRRRSGPPRREIPSTDREAR